MTPSVRIMAHRAMVALCAIGCACHLTVLTLYYFKYETVSTYASYVPLNQRLPHTSLCFVPNSQPGVKFIEYELPRDTFKQKVNDLEVNTSSVIHSCSMRNFTSEMMEERSCSSLFTTTRSHRMNLFDCYTFNVIEDTVFTSMEITSTLVTKFLLYKFSLGKDLLKFDRAMMLNHFEQWPLDEIFQVRDDQFERPKRSLYQLAYDVYELRSLEYPYDTNCLTKYPDLCTRDNLSVQPICERELCYKLILITYQCHTFVKLSGISISVRSMSAPSELMTYAPRVQLSTYIISLCSVLGFWCSLSVRLVLSTCWKCSEKNNDKVSTRLMQNWQTKLIEVSAICEIDLNALTAVARYHLSSKNSSAGSRTQRVLGLSVKLIVIIFYLREASVISVDYFAYSTGMEIYYDFKSPLSIPSLSYCFDIHEWLKIKSPALTYDHYDERMIRFSNRFNYTLREIFELVPDVDSVISKCRIRPTRTSNLVTYRDECSEWFQVSKFYQSEMMCYLIEPKINYEIDPRKYNGDTHPSIMYSIVLSEKLSRVRTYQAVISHNLPRISRSLSHKNILRDGDTFLKLLFFDYKYKLLPSPYDTRCARGTEDDKSRCMLSSPLELLSYSELYHERLDISFVTYNNLRNVSFALEMQKIETSCRQLIKDPCDAHLTKTISHVDVSSGEKLEIAIALPGYPLYKFSALPVYYFYDYFYQMASSASFWIGFSFVAIVNKLLKQPKKVKKISHFSYMKRLTECIEEIVERRLRMRRREKSYCPTHVTVTRLLCLCGLIIGFIVHCVFTTRYYFQYPVRIDTRLEFEKNFTGLRASVCVPIDQMNLKGNFSLENIWSMSPSEDNLIIRCGLRGAALPKLSHLPTLLLERIMPSVDSPSLCHSLFKVKKFMTLGMVCYEFKPAVNSGGRMFDVEHHIRDSNLDHYYTLNSSISRYNLAVFLSRHNSQASRFFTSSVKPVPSNKNLVTWFGHAVYSIESLSYPYDTGNLSFSNVIKCVRKCITAKTRKKLGLLASCGEAVASQLSLYRKLETTVTNESWIIRKKCGDECSKGRPVDATDSIYLATFFNNQAPEHDASERMRGTNTLKFYGSGYLISSTKLYPVLRLIDLVIFIGSIYSILFGIAAIQLFDHLLAAQSDSLADNYKSLVDRLDIVKGFVIQRSRREF